MRLLRDEPSVLLDAGPFFRFCEADLLADLAGFFGERAEITADVGVELRRRSRHKDPAICTHPNLRQLDELGFPQTETQLSPNELFDVDLIRKNDRDRWDHPAEDRGEISVVVLARGRTGQLAVIDDGYGQDLAALNGVEVTQTTQVACEMVASGLLSSDDGWTVYESVFHQERKSFEALVAACEAATAG